MPGRLGLQRQLQGLVHEVTSGDALLTSLDAVARKTYGDTWESRAQRRLAEQTDRVARRRRPHR